MDKEVLVRLRGVLLSLLDMLQPINSLTSILVSCGLSRYVSIYVSVVLCELLTGSAEMCSFSNPICNRR